MATRDRREDNFKGPGLSWRNLKWSTTDQKGRSWCRGINGEGLAPCILNDQGAGRDRVPGSGISEVHEWAEGDGWVRAGRRLRDELDLPQTDAFPSDASADAVVVSDGEPDRIGLKALFEVNGFALLSP